MEDELVINFDEVADFVTEQTGIDRETVIKVLDAESDFFVAKGIAEVIED